MKARASRSGSSGAAGDMNGGFLSSIAGKITLRMLLVAAIPALAIGALTVGILLALASRAEQELDANQSELTRETIGANRANQSRLVLTRIDDFIDERISDAIDWSRSETISDAAGADYVEVAELTTLPSGVVDSRYDGDYRLDRSGRANRWLRSQTDGQDAFSQALITDSNGFTVAAARPTTDFTNGDEEWWLRAWAEGAYLGEVVLDESTGELGLELAVRIDDPTTRRRLGVLQTIVPLSALHGFTDELADPEQGVHVRLIDRSGQLLAETASGHDPGRLASTLAAEELQSDAYADVLEGTTPIGYLVMDDVVGGFGRSEPVRTVERLGVNIANHGWIVIVDQPAESALAPLDGLETLSSDLNTTARIMAIAVAVSVLIALALAFVLARHLANRIAEPLKHLRREANRLADRDLPGLVSSLRSQAASAEVPRVRPIEVGGDGEVAELAAAFNSVRSTAVELAAEQAIGRTRDVSSLLLNLGRRNQQLVGRQLGYIDELERIESDPAVLKNLFVLDQMATRMRRNAESLVVLAGEDSARRVGHPRSIDEIVRAAVGEVEDYPRVRLASADPSLIVPTAVNDLTHLLAELIENATNFSPPEELVEVFGEMEDDGYYTLSIVDRGVGMLHDQLDGANERLGGGTFADTTTSRFLGLHVVGRLAARHGIDARLIESPVNGTTAKVTLPPSCIAQTPAPVGDLTGSTLAEAPPDEQVDHQWPAPRPQIKPTHRDGYNTPDPVSVPVMSPDIDIEPAAHPQPPRPPQPPERAPRRDLTPEPVAQADLDEDPAIEATTGLDLDIDLVAESDPASDFIAEPAATADAIAEPAATADAVAEPAATAEAVAEPIDRPDSEHDALPVAIGGPTLVADLAPKQPQEDDTAGIPIPPFKARESKRDLASGPLQQLGTEPGLAGDTAHPLHVRQRVRSTEPSADAILEPVASSGGADGKNPLARAAAVQAKLDRFATGVSAAKKGEPDPTGKIKIDLSAAQTAATVVAPEHVATPERHQPPQPPRPDPNPEPPIHPKPTGWLGLRRRSGQPPGTRDER